MPAISIFYGIVILMYTEQNSKHHEPHIHVRYQGDEAVLGLNGNLLAGKLPPKKLRMVQVWMDIHQEDLETDWEIVENGGEAFKIEPLR